MTKLNIIDKEINIIQLKYPENIRKRPGKLIGSTENADVILREIVDNAVDELFGSKKANFISIQTPTSDCKYYIVSDNGRGLPIKYDFELLKTKAELAVASLDAGSKFEKTINSIATGMNGVGSTCTNALSEEFIVMSIVTDQNYLTSIEEVKNLYESGKRELYYYLRFNQGLKIDESCDTLSNLESRFGFKVPKSMSTIVLFIPDPIIFIKPEATYHKRNVTYVRKVSELFYDKSIRIELNGEDISSDFQPYKFGFTKLVEVEDYKKYIKSANFYVNFEVSTNMSVTDLSGSVNSLIVNSGIHLDYVKSAWISSLRSCYNINHNYLLSGLRLNVLVVCGEADFSSQTKERCTKLDNLTSNEVSGILMKEFKKIIQSNREYFDQHINRLEEYATSLVQISTINKIKSMIVVSGDGNTRIRSKINSNVRDASSSDRKNCELFIVEGKSAAGTILKSRDSKFQAIIELRGVPMNAIDANLDELLANSEMTNIIQAIGVGVNEYHNLNSPRYSKIIIAADSDSDGGRIASLILGMIARKMTFLIEKGMVFILETPLYRQGSLYIYPSEDTESLLDRSKTYTRYKGLGEISVGVAREVITSPETRKLTKVTLEGVESALNLLTKTVYRKDLMIEESILIDPFNLGINL